MKTAPGSEESSPDTDTGKEAYDFRDSNEYEDNDLPDYRYDYGNCFFGGQMLHSPVAEEWDFRKDLKQQLGCLPVTQKERKIGEYLIDCCNEKGFLEGDAETLADEFSLAGKCWTTAEEITSVLDKIRILEPQGVGSRSVGEFYIFQLRSRQKQLMAVNALRLLELHYTDLLERKWDKIRRSMNQSAEEIQALLQYIASLKTTPVPECKQANDNIVPDFILETEDDQLQIRLHKPHSSFLRINSFWKEKVKAVTTDRHADKPTKEYMKQKLSSAQWFIDAIQQREHNLLKTKEAIAGFQKAYLLTGEAINIRPMILKNIADITKIDISTVSRLTSNKYVASPFGNICLKKLFSEGVATVSGDMASTRVMETALARIIHSETAEDPYTDQQITQLLLQQGFCLARRTVSKYRKKLKLPRWGLRKAVTNQNFIRVNGYLPKTTIPEIDI